MENITLEKNAAQALMANNGEAIPLSELVDLPYNKFYQKALDLLEQPQCHCLAYFAIPNENSLRLVCAIADDEVRGIHILSHSRGRKSKAELESLSRHILGMHIFERELHENWGIPFANHPWLKPVRYAHNRADRKKIINDYPFYKIKSHELHEVGVGPIHAGVIEPGHFRFLCNGENVFHLEIQLGWQHRGVEQVFLEKTKLLQRIILSESITGDTTIGHAWAYCQAVEGLAGFTPDKRLKMERSIALELERMAVHVGDLSAMCTDVAYQLGNAAFGALRTPVINFTQAWCGNRFGKGLIRVGGTNYPLTPDLRLRLESMLEKFEKQFDLVAERTFSLPSVLKRFEGIGKITTKQASLIGAVGMVAKMAGVKRDTRMGLPFGAYRNFQPEMPGTGDVHARAMLRRLEIKQSIHLIRGWLGQFEPPVEHPAPDYDVQLRPNSIAFSVTEGWRGEICHVVVTDQSGGQAFFKVKDPSMHNWKALELSLRNLEISDFPINNKSYDLSYCGHDL